MCLRRFDDLPLALSLQASRDIFTRPFDIERTEAPRSIFLCAELIYVYPRE